MARRFVYVVRHGETDWNAAERWQGHTDIPLNANGREQARRTAALLRGTVLAGIVASDLSRAEETARILAEELGVPISYVDPSLRERSFGCFEGLTRAECERLHPDAWRTWLADRRPPVGAETNDVLTARMVAAVGRAAERVARDDGAVVVVTHGGALRAVVAAATGQWPPPVQNGAMWRLAWEDRLVGGESM